MESLAEYLNSKNVVFKQAAGHELVAECFFPGCDARPGKRKLYINSETWLYSCKVCDATGGKKTLLGFFGDVDDTDYVPGANPASRLQVLTEYTAMAQSVLENNDDMISYLFGRGLSAQTILDAKIGYVPRGFSVCRSLPNKHSIADLKATGMLREDGTEFHSGKITIPYLSRDKTLSVRGKDPKGKYTTPAGDQVRLYNADSLRGAEDVVVTEGEFDCLILQQHLQQSVDQRLRRMAVVAIPGTQSLPGGSEGFADYFRDARRVYLMFDPDDAGKKGAVRAKEILGSKARIVQLPDDELLDADGKIVSCDLTEYLRRETIDHPFGGHHAKDIGDLITNAEMAGKRVFSITDTAARWRADKIARPGLKLGWPSLDAVLSPGLRPGNVAIPLAKTGVGKTVFLANLTYHMRNVPWLHITLENTAEEFFELLWRIYHFHNPTAEDFSIERDFPYLGIFDENRLSLDDFGLLIEEYKDQFGVSPEGGSIDYLGYLAHQSGGDGAYNKNTAAVMRVKEMAKHARMAIVVPAQVNRGIKDGAAFEGDEARDSGVIEETADFLFGLYRPAEAVDAQRVIDPGRVTHELTAQVLKSRRGGKGRVARLSMSHASLAIVDANDSVLSARVQQENAMLNRGFKYPEIYRESRDVALSRAQLRIV